MESLVRKKIGKETGRIFRSEVDTITSLSLDSSCSDLTLSEINKITNLTSLEIIDSKISDISALSKLTKLKYLGFR